MNFVWGIVSPQGGLLETTALESMHKALRLSSAWSEPAFYLADRMAVGASAFQAGEPTLTPPKPISRRQIILGSASRLSNRSDLIETLALPRIGNLTDGELIFEAYRKYRSECVHLLRGQWAFALWDAEEQRCFLARDATGTSPLYWRHNRQRLVFASSMKALLAYPGFPHEPDLCAVACTLAWRVGPDGDDTTAYKNVHQLLPGRQLDFRDNAAKVTRWWRPENLSALHLPKDEDYYQAFTEVYREAVRNCVQQRARRWQPEQTALEPVRGRTAISIVFLSGLKGACW
jgi:asparagine synthase (glutamine-hydrolysing)